MELQDLKKIGLTQGEIKIYSALLDLGESTRTELAKKSGISPSKIYDVANRLLEKGIISSVKKNNILHFSAANPETIKDFLDQKEQEIQKEKKLVNDMLPTLIAKYTKTEESADVEVFYGWDGMKTVFRDIANTLSKDDENYIFGASQGQNTKQSDNFFTWYYNLVNEKKYKQKIIFNENVKGNKDRTAHFYKKPHEVRYLHQDTFTEINLYKNTVLFVILLTKPIIIRIKNTEAADSFKKFFDSIWKIAKP
ncbi:MAG: helix-turn-helix domain-containing protein [Nanoarchaeota archaeon]|nr:helix-turn-helix domain-containing protein [Nanoarchaeota archaeon]